MADYSGMSAEEVASHADPLNRIVNRDYPILGYVPTDEQVAVAQAELDQINETCRELNKTNPQRVGALGPQSKGLNAKDVARLIKVHQEEAQAAVEAAEALTRGESTA